MIKRRIGVEHLFGGTIMKPDHLLNSCDRFVIGRHLSGPSVFETRRAIGRANTAEDPVKRAMDFMVAALILFCLVPVLMVVAILIKFDSPGPVLFRQRRSGLGGKVFMICKFRTMQVMENGGKMQHAVRNDPRVTRIGGLLRASSIDELPQLWNIVVGDMSLVGPRPHALAHDSLYRSLLPTYQWRFRARPGLTGLAQVQGLRGEIHTLADMDRRVASDRSYVDNWSLLLDIGILLKTVPCVLGAKGAY
jgi:putative colanic acid biosynthesis UDP-glucose lipid carrier transferase